MANAADTPCRLCLVTPPDYDPVAFRPRLADALAGGDVASLVVTAPQGDPDALQRATEAFVPMAAERGVATLIHNDVRVAQRARADGVHIDTGVADLAAAIEALRGRKIVGAGGLGSRHAALDAGEREPDYVFFGRLDGDDGDAVHPKALDLAAWWASVAVIPAIVMGGRSLASVDAAAENRIDFVALAAAIWEHPQGPAQAVASANERLAMTREAVA
jgi:thiamine-phosphate pyrophosphorylase